MIDAVFSSRSIDQKQAQDLTTKRQKFLCKKDRKSFAYISKSSEMTRTDNKLVFYNLDMILDAIEIDTCTQIAEKSIKEVPLDISMTVNCLPILLCMKPMW